MSYALETTDGDPLGFLFLAGEGEGDSGDCIFRAFPMKAELLDTKEVESLFDYQELWEFQWTRTPVGIDIRHLKTGDTATLVGDVLMIQGLVYKAVQMEDS